MSLSDGWMKNRWFVLAVLFLLVNSYAVFNYTAKKTMLADVVDVSFEAGKSGVVKDTDSLKWSFTSGMVKSDDTGTWIAGTGPVTIEPAVAGRFCWVATNELVFQPSEPWCDCTEYLAWFADDFAGGKVQDYEVSFHTAALNLNYVTQINFDSERRCTIKLNFNSVPVRAALKDYLSVTDGNGNDIGWECSGKLDAKEMFIETSPIKTDKFTVRMKKGMPAKAGSLGITDTTAWKCNYDSDLVLGQIKPVSSGFADGYVNVQFNASPDFSKIADYIDITPPLRIVVGKLPYYWSSGFKLTGKFEPGKQYTIILKSGLPALNGAKLKNEVRRQIYFPDRPAVLTFRADGQYLSAKGNMLVPVTSVNISKISVSAERIYPNNLVQFAMRESCRYQSYYKWGNGSSDKLSHIVAKKEYSLSSIPNTVTETRLNMTELMGEYSSGAFLLTVKSDNIRAKRQLVVVTDIGIAVKRSAKDLLIWANRINSLEPVAEGLVKVYSEANQEIFNGKTDKNGLVHIVENMDDKDKVPFLITIKHGKDISFLKLDGTKISPDKNLGGAAYLKGEYEAYIFSDRGIYRPGETAHFKAVLRGCDLNAVDQTFPLNLKIVRPDGRGYKTLTASLNKWGTVAYDLLLPTYVMTGKYRLELSIPGSKQVLSQTDIAVEDFVPPQIKVEVDSKQERIIKDFEYNVNARYLFGSPASGLLVSSKIQLLPVLFAPDGWDGYIFNNAENSFKNVNKKVGGGKLDVDGYRTFKYTIPKNLKPASAIKVVAGVTVREVSGRAVSSYTSRIVDVYSHYVGIKREHCGDIVKVGKNQNISLLTLLPDGEIAEKISSLKIELSRIEWSSVLKKHKDNTYSYQSERRLISVSKEKITLNKGAATYSFKPTSAGQYLLTATSTEKGGSSASFEFYAGSPDDEWQSWSLDKPGQVELVLDKASYKIGETATLLVKSPFAGKALLTIESDHVIVSRVFDMKSNTIEIEVPISYKLLPNVYCTINVIREAKPEKIWRAHRAVGAIALSVDVPQKRLNVKIDAPAEIRPKSSLVTTVKVTDADGKGVPAELTIAAVDEGICMLTAFKTPDPLKYYMRKRMLGVEQYDLYNLLMPEIAVTLRGAASTPGGDAALALRARLNPIDAKRFKPVALWKKSVITDTNGNASFTFDIPEFSGELRLMVVAVSKKATGSSDVPIKVKRKVVVISSLPRFMAPGDEAIMPVTVFNGIGKEQNISVTINCDGPLTVDNNKQESIIDKSGNKNFEFKLSALKTVGKGVVEIKVVAGDEKYSEKFEIAVRPASARVIKSDIGVVKPGKSITVLLPSNYIDSTTENSFVCSGQATAKLNGALDYLLKYPYGCLEQTVSGSFPLLYLTDLVDVVRPGSMTKEDVSQYVQAGIYRVLSMQQSNGSFSYWPNYRDSYQWGTVYAVNFLLEAKNAGYTVPPEQLKSAIAYLKKALAKPIGSRITSNHDVLRSEMRRRSYICYVLALYGQPEHGWIARLQEQNLQDTATQINLAASLAVSGKRQKAAAILRQLGIKRVAGTERQTYGSLNSGIRNSAMMLMVWLDINPVDPVVTQLVNQLGKMQVNGGWFTTQDNAMALMALGKYNNLTTGEQKPFKATISWHKNGKDISREFTDKDQLHLTTQEIPAGAKVTIKNSGPGILYFNWRSSGVPTEGGAVAENRQMSVSRRLLTLEGEEVNSQNLIQGELYVVKITIDTHREVLHNLAIEDLLPAGLEIENAALKTSQLVQWIKKKTTFKPQHIDIRDDRVVLFIDRIRGINRYYYVVRAVTRGEFVYPAISGECMYDPAVRSVGDKGKLRIEKKTALLKRN